MQSLWFGQKDHIIKVVNIAQNICLNLGISNPKIAVAGLNPHSGKNAYGVYLYKI